MENDDLKYKVTHFAREKKIGHVLLKYLKMKLDYA